MRKLVHLIQKARYFDMYGHVIVHWRMRRRRETEQRKKRERERERETNQLGMKEGSQGEE